MMRVRHHLQSIKLSAHPNRINDMEIDSSFKLLNYDFSKCASLKLHDPSKHRLYRIKINCVFS